MDLKKTLPPVAKSIYIHCKKCDTNRYCTVLAHKTLTSAKVKCEVCGSQSTYNVNKTYTPGAKKKKTTRKGSEAAMWETMKTEKGSRSAESYTIKKVFSNDDSIDHPKFGLGFVTKVYHNKIEVLFSDGLKELLHARQ